MKQSFFFSLAFMALAFVGCNPPDKTEMLLGKWQPVGDNSRILEFTEEGYYNLFVGDMNIFQDIEDYGRIKYQLSEDGDIIKLNLKDESMTKDFVKGQIEIIDNDHINIAFYQKEGEINVKEEYQRVK